MRAAPASCGVPLLLANRAAELRPAILNPGIFLSVLRYVGGFGVALLLALFPIAMVWSGRYRKGHSLVHQQLPEIPQVSDVPG